MANEQEMAQISVEQLKEWEAYQTKRATQKANSAARREATKALVTRHAQEYDTLFAQFLDNPTS